MLYLSFTVPRFLLLFSNNIGVYFTFRTLMFIAGVYFSLVPTWAYYPPDGVKLNTLTLSHNTCVLYLTPSLVGTCGVKASSAVLRFQNLSATALSLSAVVSRMKQKLALAPGVKLKRTLRLEWKIFQSWRSVLSKSRRRHTNFERETTEKLHSLEIDLFF